MAKRYSSPLSNQPNAKSRRTASKVKYKDGSEDDSDEEPEGKIRSPFASIGNLNKTSMVIDSGTCSAHVSYKNIILKILI